MPYAQQSQIWKREDDRCKVEPILRALLDAQIKKGEWAFDSRFMILKHGLEAFVGLEGRKASKVLATLKRMRAGVKDPVRHFETTYARYFGSAGQRGRSNPWVLIQPIYMSFEGKSPIRLKIQGNTITLKRMSTIEKRIGRKSLRTAFRHAERHGIVIGDRLPESCLVASGSGDGVVEAWAQVECAVNCVRGLLEIAHHRGRFNFSSHPRALVRFPSPNWIITQHDQQTTIAGLLRDDAGTNRTSARLPPEQVARVKQEAKALSAKPKENATTKILTHCLALYAAGMDQGLPWRRLLALWQLAEALTRSETSRGDTRTTVRRLAAFFRPGEIRSATEAVLTRLAQLRNKIVHRGEECNVEDGELSILKLACEIGLSWMSENRTSLPTREHLDQYYSSRDLPERGLAATSAAIQLIRKERVRTRKSSEEPRMRATNGRKRKR